MKVDQKKNLFVTVADVNWLDQAKALFSSAYWNAGWDGNFMFLAHNVPEKELRWFKERGILIYNCMPIIPGKIGTYPSTVLSKLYLFTSYFKRWNTVTYLDGDVIVRASLDELTKVQGFAAVPDMGDYKVSFNIINDQSEELYRELCQTYDINKTGFNSGVFAFNTQIIAGERTFEELKALFFKYLHLLNGDQPLLNLYFNSWTRLPRVFGVCIPSSSSIYEPLIQKEQKGLFHLCGYYKPWHKENVFFDEWKENLRKAEEIDVSKTHPSVYHLDGKEIYAFEKLYDKLKDRINTRVELLNLYGTNKKIFRKRVIEETLKRSPLRLKLELLYFFISLVPENTKENLKSLVRKIGLLPKDSIILEKQRKQQIGETF